MIGSGAGEGKEGIAGGDHESQKLRSSSMAVAVAESWRLGKVGSGEHCGVGMGRV